ncbi:hypothetical protein EC836_104256 [Erwinia sp. JUb26]|nr:hypothetical protein EC836_104256 [Erwinia sp. JUb26]
MNFFEELKTSLEGAVEIKKGNKAPSAVTRYDIADVRATARVSGLKGGRNNLLSKHKQAVGV